MEKIIIRTTDGATAHIEEEVNELLSQGWRIKQVSVAANQSGTYGRTQLLVFALCKEEEEKRKH